MAAQVASKLVKPPIRLFGLEGSYINALFSAASKKNQLNVVEGDLSFVSNLYKVQPKFRDFVTDPFVKPQQKYELFSKLKINPLSVNFLSALADYNRMKYLPTLEESFKKTMAAVRKEIICTVTSAKALSDAKKKDVEQSLAGFTEKKMIVNYQTDPSLIGGLVVNFNNEHLIDMSIKTQLRSITTALKSA